MKSDPLALLVGGLGSEQITNSCKTCLLQKPKLVLPLHPTVREAKDTAQNRARMASASRGPMFH